MRAELYTRKAGRNNRTAKALKINEQFQESRQFWSYLVEKGLMDQPREFLIQLPHMSIVHGKENVEYLKKRYEALVDNRYLKIWSSLMTLNN